MRHNDRNCCGLSGLTANVRRVRACEREPPPRHCVDEVVDPVRRARVNERGVRSKLAKLRRRRRVLLPARSLCVELLLPPLRGCSGSRGRGGGGGGCGGAAGGGANARGAPGVVRVENLRDESLGRGAPVVAAATAAGGAGGGVACSGGRDAVRPASAWQEWCGPLPHDAVSARSDVCVGSVERP